MSRASLAAASLLLGCLAAASGCSLKPLPLPPEETAADLAPPEDLQEPTPPADLTAGEAPLFSESLVGADVPAARVGMFYLAWHAPAATALRAVRDRGAAQLTIEDVIRSDGGRAFADILTRHGLEGQAMSFYYQARPKLGFYCLYRARSGQAGLVPDCPDIARTTETHAAQLVDAGVDFVVLDATNLTGLDAAGDLLQLRPIEVLFEEWARVRASGRRTPQIAVWHAVPAGSTQWQGYAAIYQNPAYDGLVMRDRKSGKKVFFVVDPPDEGRRPDATILARLQDNGGRGDVILQRMWTLDRTDPALDRWAFMSYCQAGGRPTTSIVDEGPCAQPYTARSALGSAVAVAPSYQTGYASLPFGSPGKLSGLTYGRQWQTALAVRPDYVFISGWNELTAQPQPNPYGADPFARSMGLERDPDGARLFVDTYGGDFGRDIEPTEEYGSFYYDLTRACVKLWRGGARSCDGSGDACCAAARGDDWANVYVLFNAGASDTLLTTAPGEKAALLAQGWREVCARTGTPSSFCLRGDEPRAPAGPFLAYRGAGAGRRALYRCLAGNKHFYSLDPGCEGQKTEAPIVWLAAGPSGATPRRATRCYRAATGEHFVAVGAGCPAGAADEGLLGYVR